MNAYPTTPGYKTIGPSKEAAKSMIPRSKLLRDRCLDALRISSMTADECANILNVSILSVRPRFSELCQMDLIEATTLRGKNASGRRATVWKIKS